MSKRDEPAYTRGVRAAGIWKQLKHTLVSWDQRCAAWTKNHNAPVWVGRVPIVTAILVSLAGLIAGGFVVALIVAFIWSIAFILQHLEKKSLFENNQQPTSSSYTRSSLFEDCVIESEMNGQFDGPYKSPGED